MDIEIWLWETIPYLVGIGIGVWVVIKLKRKKNAK